MLCAANTQECQFTLEIGKQTVLSTHISVSVYGLLVEPTKFYLKWIQLYDKICVCPLVGDRTAYKKLVIQELISQCFITLSLCQITDSLHHGSLAYTPITDQLLATWASVPSYTDALLWTGNT